MRRCLTRAARTGTQVHISVTSLLLVLAMSCGTASQRPATIPRPGIETNLAHEIYFGSAQSAPATVMVRVTNSAPVPIMVTSIEVDSSGMNEWGLLRQTRMFRASIEPNTSKELAVDATAVTLVSRRREPLTFNVRVQFESEGKHWQEFTRVMFNSPPM
jgi:hypothetical protein